MASCSLLFKHTIKEPDAVKIGDLRRRQPGMKLIAWSSVMHATCKSRHRQQAGHGASW